MSNALKHYGILGMKWGVRRTDAQLDRARGVSRESSSNEETHEDYKKTRASKSASSMSNAELKDIINRLQMEKQYAQLTRKEKSAGAKFVTSVLSSAAQQTASKYAAQYMSKGVDALIKAGTKK